MGVRDESAESASTALGSWRRGSGRDAEYEFTNGRSCGLVPVPGKSLACRFPLLSPTSSETSHSFAQNRDEIFCYFRIAIILFNVEADAIRRQQVQKEFLRQLLISIRVVR